MSGKEPELERAMADLVVLAHAEHDPRWVDAATFSAHAWQSLRGAAPGETHEELLAALTGCRAGDLYLALACARGVPEALALLEREHLSRVPKYVAAIDSSTSFTEELTQRLRARILVSPAPATPARIVTYSGRGPLGGWIRMSAVRLARDLAREMGRVDLPEERADFEALDADPELALMKRKYGEIVSRAFLASLNDLEAGARTALRMHYVDGLTIDQVGVALGVSRASGARALARARALVMDGVRERLAREHALEPEEAESLLRFVRSHIDLSIGGALAGPK